MTSQKLAIVGAGIAGLTSALCFARHGIATTIFEKASQLEEVGAGLQLSPNAAFILEQLGVWKLLEPHLVHPQNLVMQAGDTLKTIMSMPVRDLSAARWQGPYAVTHRASLQHALLKAVLSNPLIKLELGQSVESPDALALRDPQNGNRPDLLIAADGVWSRLRNFVSGAPDVTFSGNIAWRMTLSAENAPDFFNPQNVTAYLGPAGHVIVYPLRKMQGEKDAAQQVFNIVAIAASIDPGEGWVTRSEHAQQQLLARSFDRWHPQLREILLKVPNTTFWPLFQAGAGRWSNDARDLLLIGDAAHAMMPFAAQGAAMAIEDAYELAGYIAKSGLTTGVTHYETVRQQRIRKVRNRGGFNQFVYHARGPVRLGRDLILALRSPQKLAADLDWLYAYRQDL